MTSELKSARTNRKPTQTQQVRELQERLASLELALEDQGWQRLTGGSDSEFSREALRAICHEARSYYLKNPLIQRGVNVQTHYVFGQGVEISAADPEINEVVQEFLDDGKNQAEFTGYQAQSQKESELTLFGNLFFTFFTTPRTGRVRVRTIPVDEIDDILTNPEDSKDPWWYKRTYQRIGLDGVAQSVTAYYPDWRYTGQDKPAGTLETAPIYHVKVGGLSDMKFGVPETYAAHDWAKAYKSFLEDWATIVRAYSRFAWQLNTKGGSGSIARAKAKLGTTYGSSSGTGETNPPPVPGSTFIGQEGVSMTPIRTSGATTSADDGRRLLLMVAATMGLPESFFGDVSVGTLATARSLDRPTELKFTARRTLWADVLRAILRYVVVQAVKARRIAGRLIPDDDGTPRLELGQMTDRDTGEGIDRDPTINVTFPPILEHDVAASVGAIVQAATLGASGTLAGTIDAQTVTRLLLTALGVKDVDALMKVIYPPDADPEPETPTPEESVEEPRPERAPTEEPTPEDAQTREAFTEALRELRAALRRIVEPAP